MAGFEVTTNGRFWVTAEDSGPEWIFLLLAAMAAVAGIGVVGAFLLKVLF
jgi:hypothetical protein